MGGGHVSRPDFGMAQPDPAHPLTEFYLLVQQALNKAGCFALPALYASLQAPARRIYPEEAREYLRLAPQAGEGFVRLQADKALPCLRRKTQILPRFFWVDPARRGLQAGIQGRQRKAACLIQSLLHQQIEFGQRMCRVRLCHAEIRP